MVVAQLARASDCGSEGRRFEPGLPPHDDLACYITLGQLLCSFYSFEPFFFENFFALYLEFFLLKFFPLGGLPETDCLFSDLILSSCLCLFI